MMQVAWVSGAILCFLRALEIAEEPEPGTQPTVIGYRVNSPQAFVLFLALASGALFYVIGEMFAVGRRFHQPPAAAWGILIGFLAAYAKDLILTIGGA